MMRTLVICMAYITLMLASSSHGAHADPDDSALRSAIVTQDGRPVASLKPAQPGGGLSVGLDAGDHQIQVLLQLQAVPGRQVFLLTQLQDTVLSALSDNGVVGMTMEGGWVLEVDREHEVVVTLTGRSPEGVQSYDLAELITVSEGQIRKEARLEAEVRRPLLNVPLLPALSIASGVVIVVAAGAIVVWRRRASQYWNT